MSHRIIPLEHRRRILLIGAAVVVLAGAAVGALVMSSAGTSGTSARSSLPATVSRKPLADQTPRQILADATSAQARAHSMHVRGAITAAGVSVTFALDVEAPGDGKGIFSERGASITIVRKGSTLYLYAGSKFWASNGDQKYAAALSGKWLEAPASQTDFASLAQFFELFRLTTQLYPAGSSAISKGPPTTVAGTKVIPLTGKAIVKGVTQSTTLFIATAGTPYVVEADASNGNEHAVIEFSRFGERVAVEVPPHAVSYDKLVNPTGAGAPAAKGAGSGT